MGSRPRSTTATPSSSSRRWPAAASSSALADRRCRDLPGVAVRRLIVGDVREPLVLRLEGERAGDVEAVLVLRRCGDATADLVLEHPPEELLRALLLRVVDHVGGCSLFDDDALVHEDHLARDVAGEPHLVGDD